MKNKHLLLVFTASFLSFLSFSQIPGYLGKRFIVHGNIYSMVAITGPTAANKGWGSRYEEDTRSFALSNRFELQGEYVISRQRSVSLGLSYLKTGMGLQVNTLPIIKNGGDGSFDRHSLFYNIRALGVNLGISRYNTRKGALAPLGKHRTWSLWANFVNGNILDKLTYYNDSNIKTHEKIFIDPKFIRYGIGFSSHENSIFFDKLVLNIGWQVNLPFSILAIFPYNGNEDTNGTIAGNQAHYTAAAGYRLRQHDLFTMKIGFGYLAF